jgi:hypothetical protein
VINPLTREEALAFREKYRRMGDKHRAGTPEEALRDFALMLRAAFDLGLDDSLRADDDEVLLRWARVKQRASGQS